jgi:hypothetical protein
MAVRVIRHSRTPFALAIVSVALTACSAAPTAPSATRPNAAAGAGPAETAAAQADRASTITITKGTLALQSLLPGTVLLQGSHGFRFDGRIQSGNEPSNYCGPFNPCQPGATVAFTGTWLGGDLTGAARLQGDEFEVGFEPPSMLIEVTGSFTAPPHVTDSATVTVPFAATGSLFRAYPSSPFQLTGRGRVTFTLEWQTAIGGWAIRFSSFDFGGGPN